MTEVARRLGYEPSGGIHRFVKGHIVRLGLDTSHMLGQGWAAGLSNPNCRRPRPLAEILVVGCAYPSSKLRQRLIAEGLKHAHCEHCGLDEWRGERLPLVLDHANGDHTDNRIENLRILCPNCHSVTESWCRKVSSRRRTPIG